MSPGRPPRRCAGTCRAQCVGVLRRYDWRILEIDALIGLGRLGGAETALAELEISDARGLRTPTSRRTPGCARRGSA